MMGISRGLASVLLLLALCASAPSQSSPCWHTISGFAYPGLALRARLQGSVELGLKYASSGVITDVIVIRGDRTLGELAKFGLQKWRLEPSPQGGQLVFKILFRILPRERISEGFYLESPSSLVVSSEAYSGEVMPSRSP